MSATNGGAARDTPASPGGAARCLYCCGGPRAAPVAYHQVLVGPPVCLLFYKQVGWYSTVCVKRVSKRMLSNDVLDRHKHVAGLLPGGLQPRYLKQGRLK